MLAARRGRRGRHGVRPLGTHGRGHQRCYRAHSGTPRGHLHFTLSSRFTTHPSILLSAPFQRNSHADSRLPVLARLRCSAIYDALSLSLSLFSPRLNEIAVFFATRSVNFDPLPSNVLESKFFGSSLVSSSSCTISYYTINDFFLFLFFFFLLGPLEIPSILLTFPSGKKQSNSIVDCQV